jgi:hypothetical protein
MPEIVERTDVPLDSRRGERGVQRVAERVGTERSSRFYAELVPIGALGRPS